MSSNYLASRRQCTCLIKMLKLAPGREGAGVGPPSARGRRGRRGASGATGERMGGATIGAGRFDGLKVTSRTGREHNGRVIFCAKWPRASDVARTPTESADLLSFIQTSHCVRSPRRHLLATLNQWTDLEIKGAMTVGACLLWTRKMDAMGGLISDEKRRSRWTDGCGLFKWPTRWLAVESETAKNRIEESVARVWKFLSFLVVSEWGKCEGLFTPK